MTSAPPPIDPGTSDQPGPTEPPPAPGPSASITGGREMSLPAALLVYTVLRLLLVAVLTALLMIFMPLIVALLFAYALQLPLAYLFFGKWRRQVNDGIARATARRRAERARLQGALSGDLPVVDLPANERAADRPAGPSGA